MKILQLAAIAALSLSLIQMAYAEHDGKDGMHCDHRHAMQDADVNKDGVVSHDEFIAAHQKMAEEMFAKLDTNKDGKIDKAEFDAMHSKMGKKCNMKEHKMDDSTK